MIATVIRRRHQSSGHFVGDNLKVHLNQIIKKYSLAVLFIKMYVRNNDPCEYDFYLVCLLNLIILSYVNYIFIVKQLAKMWFPEQKDTVAVDKILYRIDKTILYGRKNVFSMYTGQKSHGSVNRFFFFSFCFVIKFSTILCLLFMDCWQYWCIELFSAWPIFNSTFFQ